MRTLRFIVMILVALLVTSCANKSGVNTTPTKPGETFGQRVERLKAEESKRIAEETPQEKRIRLRAQVIEAQEELKRLDEERAKYEPASMKQARKEVTKVDKAEAEILGWANITGCEAGTVAVNPVAVRPNWIARRNVMVSVRVINTTPLTYDIQTPSLGIGLAVRGLCPGGAVTLTFARNMLTDSTQVDVALIAMSQPSAGQGVVTEERRFWLNASDVQYNRVKSEVWQLTRRQ